MTVISFANIGIHIIANREVGSTGQWAWQRIGEQREISAEPFEKAQFVEGKSFCFSLRPAWILLPVAWKALRRAWKIARRAARCRAPPEIGHLALVSMSRFSA
jgi:hypothetical protein